MHKGMNCQSYIRVVLQSIDTPETLDTVETKTRTILQEHESRGSGGLCGKEAKHEYKRFLPSLVPNSPTSQNPSSTAVSEQDEAESVKEVR